MNTQSPTTEAEAFASLWEIVPRLDRPEVRRIVTKALEAVRAEGRREAVRAIREGFAALRGEQFGHAYWGQKLGRLLDEVAALNASESPPRVSILDSDPAEGEGMDDWLGDASESPPTDPLCAVDICAHPSHSVGDASESVQPPESHDDE